MLRPYRSKIPQYLVGSRDVREEDPVAQPVERHPQRGEALSGGAVNGGDAEVLGEPVLRGEPKALSTQLVVVGQIGPPFAGASSGDVVRDRKSTRLNSSHLVISYAVFCLKKKK